MQLHKCSCVPLPVNLGCSNTVGQSDFQSHFSLEIKVGEMLTQKIFACIYYLWYMCFIFSYFYFLWFSDRYLNCSHLTLNVLPWILWDLLETLPPNSFPQGPPVEPECWCGVCALLFLRGESARTWSQPGYEPGPRNTRLSAGQEPARERRHVYS